MHSLTLQNTLGCETLLRSGISRLTRVGCSTPINSTHSQNPASTAHAVPHLLLCAVLPSSLACGRPPRNGKGHLIKLRCPSSHFAPSRTPCWQPRRRRRPPSRPLAA